MKTRQSNSCPLIRRIILLMVLGLSFTSGWSQNYLKEVWEEMDNTDRFSNLMKLSQVQGIYPGKAVIYFFIGNIYDQYLREADPLVMYDAVVANYYQFNNYYGLLKLKLDEKQANQYREYFGPVEIISDKKKAHLEDILAEIKKRETSTAEYFRNASNVHENYVRCITKYNECLFRFREITRAYPDLKTLFLLTDNRLQTDFRNLALNFDSVQVFFNAYKEACKRIPSLQNIYDYQLNDITTYRLEGLTEADFYAPVVKLWNYSAWARQFLQTMETDINDIRKGTEASDRELTDKTNKLKKEAVYYPGEIREPTRDKLYYLTGKYDYASITNELMTYRKQKLHFLSLIRSGMNDPANTTDFELSPKLMFYNSLADEKTALNAFADQMKRKITTGKTAKYIQFFFDHYKGMEGFARWCELEKLDNNQIFDKNLSNLEEFCKINRNLFPYRDSMLTFNRMKVPFGVQLNAGQTGKDTLLTLSVTPFQKRWFYLSGLETDKKGSQTPFLAKVKPEGSIDWLVSPIPKGSKYEEIRLHSVQVTVDSACWVLGSASSTLPDSSRQFFTYKSVINWKGKPGSYFVPDSAGYPVMLWVDDINEQYLSITEGSPDTQGYKPLKLKLFNFRDSLVWAHTILTKGKFGNVLVTNSDFFITLSYHALEVTRAAGRKILPVGQSAIAGIYLQRNGNISHINDYLVSGEVQLISSEKVYDNTLQIYAKITQANQPDSYLYLLTDNKGRPTFVNDPDLRYETKTMLQGQWTK